MKKLTVLIILLMVSVNLFAEKERTISGQIHTYKNRYVLQESNNNHCYILLENNMLNKLLPNLSSTATYTLTGNVFKVEDNQYFLITKSKKSLIKNEQTKSKEQKETKNKEKNKKVAKTKELTAKEKGKRGSKNKQVASNKGARKNKKDVESVEKVKKSKKEKAKKEKNEKKEKKTKKEKSSTKSKKTDIEDK